VRTSGLVPTGSERVNPRIRILEFEQRPSVDEAEHMMRRTKKPPQKRPRSELIPVGDVITSLMTDGTLPYKPDDVEIWRVWKEVVGQTYAENAQPSKNSKKTVDGDRVQFHMAPGIDLLQRHHP